MAGVSQATVSRVLNDGGPVAPATRRRVLEAVQQLGYTPNAIARGLVTNRTQLVGVIVSDVTNPFYPEFLEASGHLLAERGFRMVFHNAAKHEGDDELTRLLLEQRVDGILFLSAELESAAVRRLVERRFPIVLANRYVDGVVCDTVVTDNRRGGSAVARHLLELGHKRIAVIAGHDRASTSRDRLDAFRDELASAAVELREELVAEGEFRYDLAYEATRRLLTLPVGRRPTAIFCVNDLMAFGALNAARATRMRVPEQLSVVGFDAVPMSGWEAFRLTTVRQPLTDMAVAAADLLVERIRDVRRAPRTTTFPSTLIVRETTAPAPRRTSRRPRRATVETKR
jgi:LacI family transcriptional regulator